MHSIRLVVAFMHVRDLCLCTAKVRFAKVEFAGVLATSKFYQQRCETMAAL